jgi:hypothetical protein
MIFLGGYMKSTEVGNKNIYVNNGLYIKENDKKTAVKLSDDICESFALTSFDNIIFVVYEDIYGNIVKITIDGEAISKDILLYSKFEKHTNKSIYTYFLNNRLITIFSTFYKEKSAIAIYDDYRGACIFDICDEFDFLSIQKNDNIVVVYKKNGMLGFSKILKEGYSSFKAIDTLNPLELFVFDSIYLLSKEENYILTDIKNNIKYHLPIVFGVRPLLYYENNTIYLSYKNNKRKTIYKIENKKIVFFKEEL